MKIYIQQSSSNFLYSAANGWVKTVLEADTFPTSIDALNYCVRQNLQNVHIRVHANDGSGFDTIFSVPQFPQRSKVPALT